MFPRNLRNPRAADPALDKKSLASLGITFTSPRVAKAGDLTSKNLAKTTVCPKLSVYLSGCAKSLLKAARSVTLLSSDHAFCLTEEVQ